ncbi:MAG: peptidoglycan DD-metalloendopeptidase family protein [Actinomycetes bacterium]
MGVRKAAGRAGLGLVGMLASAILTSGVPAVADPTSTTTPPSTPSATATATGKAATSSPSKTSTPRRTEAKKAAAKAAAAKRKAAADQKKAAAAAAKMRAQDAQRAAEQALQAAEDATALYVATQALQTAQVDLTTAKAALTTAKDELAAAQEAYATAQSDLTAAVYAEQRATRELAAVESRIIASRTDLGRLARSTYQSGGIFGEWSVALASQTPNELADRLATMQSVASAGNAMIADLEQDRADLVNSQSRLRAAREEQAAARDAARLALAGKSGAEQAARAAEQQVGIVVQARAAALEAARTAGVQDRAQYHTLLVQSGALAHRIQDLAGKLAKGTRPPQGTGDFTRPGRGAITSPYGPRMHPILHYVKVHTGIDFAAADGISYAADDGVVLLTEFNVAYGNMTVIDHGTIGGQHITTLYAHQAAFAVQPGDRVSKGQPIGVIGETGYATGPHLHFEVRVDGSPVDPAPFLVHAPLPPTPRDVVRRPPP